MIYDQLTRERYAQTQHPPEETMDLATIEADIRGAVQDGITHAEAFVSRGREILDSHLPALASAAEKAQASPVIQALEQFTLGPEDEALVASLIAKLGAYAAEHAQAAAGANVPPPGEPMPVPAAAGPVIGGQA
jgi:hypothetical protein